MDHHSSVKSSQLLIETSLRGLFYQHDLLRLLGLVILQVQLSTGANEEGLHCSSLPHSWVEEQRV